MLTGHTTHRIKAFAVALAVSVLAVSTAQAQQAQADKNGPLDPWAYNVIHRSTTQPRPLFSENSAGQHRASHRSIGQSSPLLNENSAGAGTYVPLDPAIAAAILNHSVGQTSALKSVAASVPAGTRNGFDWGDAGIGAIVALTITLFTLGVGTMMLRRSRPRLAGF
jgi:hypothetical protein